MSRRDIAIVVVVAIACTLLVVAFAGFTQRIKERQLMESQGTGWCGSSGCYDRETGERITP